MYYILIVVFVLLESSMVLAEEGDECTTNGQEGICKIISDCPYARDLLKKRIFPKTCGFIGKDPIVCCLPSENQSLLPNQSIQVPSTESPLLTMQKNSLKPILALQNLKVVSNQTIGELSRKKCMTYNANPLYPSFVIGGTPSLAREFQHMAVIGYGEKDDIQWLCGGSLISKRFVLTAAHCLDSKFGDAKYVRLGDLDLSTNDDVALPQDFTIIERIAHPSFRPPIRYHDIALLKLDREMTRTLFVIPACLNSAREHNQTQLIATGWGNTDFSGNSSSILLKVELNYIPNEECIKAFGKTSKILLPNGIIDDFQICAGGMIGKDTCQGDSGGPLQVKNYHRSASTNVNDLIGVTSFGKACGLSKAPGIYTRISSYLSWIESIAWVNETENTFVLLNKKTK